MSGSKPMEWIYYPIVGLEIKDEPDTIEPLMFEHATVVSPNDLAQFIKAMPFAVAEGESEGDEDTELQTVMIGIRPKEHDSYILVEGHGTSPEDVDDNADSRSMEVISVISLIMLVRLDLHYSCCLIGQVTNTPYQINIKFDSHRGEARSSYGYPTRAYVHHVPSPPVLKSRSELVAMLLDEPFGDLTRILLLPVSAAHESFRRVLSTATTLLYETINTTIPEPQLLGTITTIEVVLTNRQTKFATIKFRLKHLLGDAGYTYFDAESVFQSRNAFVHEGQRCQRHDVIRGVYLAVSLIAKVAQMATDFASHDEFISYLDYVQSGVRPPGMTSVQIDRWDLLPRTHSFPDYLRFRLLSYSFNRSQMGSKSEMERKLAFSKIVLIFSDKRSVDVRRAFDRMKAALTEIECPFPDYDSFESFYRTNADEVHKERDRTMTLLRRHPYFFHPEP